MLLYFMNNNINNLLKNIEYKYRKYSLIYLHLCEILIFKF